MDNKCVIIVREGISGGTASLSFRLLMALRDNGYNCMYFCRQINDENNYKLFKNNGIPVECIDDYSYKKHFDKRCDNSFIYKFVTYSIDEYLIVERLKNKYSNIESCLYYVVHHFAFGSADSLWYNRLMSIVRYRHVVRRIYSNRSILFMSDLCLKNARTVLSLKMPLAEKLVYYLPMRINDYSTNQICEKKRHNPFVISTITRLEFPFKGYVIGLLDWFERNFLRYNLELTIVGDGQGQGVFLERLSTMAEDCRKRIQYYPNIPYDQLSDIFSITDLYVGMGTTLLDAANNLTLAVPVNGYTMNLEVSGFFSENIKEVYAVGPLKPIDSLVHKLVEMSDEEYTKYINRQYDFFCKIYDINNFVNYIISSDYDNRKISLLQLFKIYLFDYSINYLTILKDQLRHHLVFKKK